jgi:hypothetical protein
MNARKFETPDEQADALASCARISALTRWFLFFCLCLGSLSAALAATNAPARARVFLVEDPQATEAFVPRPAEIRSMLDRTVMGMTGKSDIGAAWKAILFTNGVIASNELVGIKVFSSPGPNAGTRPAVAAATVEGLLAAGLRPKQIVVWDRQSVDLRLAGYYDLAERYGIRVEGGAQAGYDENTFYESSLAGSLVWGDLEFGRKGVVLGRKSYVTKLLSQEITRSINITPMLNHNLAGVTGSLYSLAISSIDNVARFEHSSDTLATAVPEIYNLPALNDKVVLNISDALICQYEGSERSLLHYSATLNQIRVSRDPVALDSLSLQELDLQRQAAGIPNLRTNLDIYKNAELLELGIHDLSRVDVIKVR